MTEKVAKTPEKGKCPSCGTEVDVKRWTKVDRVFESIECLGCGNIHGRIIGPTYTGIWHYLGVTAAHELKISRRVQE